MKHTVMTGLRKGEAIDSFNLIIESSESGDLTEYYNEKLNCLKHFKFRKLFLRKTKNVYIGFIPEPFLQKLIEASPITYPSIFKRLIRKNLACRINELTDFYATFTVGNGLIREEVDLLQGRIPPNILIKHYWSPSLKELRVFKALKQLEQRL